MRAAWTLQAVLAPPLLLLLLLLLLFLGSGGADGTDSAHGARFGEAQTYLTQAFPQQDSGLSVAAPLRTRYNTSVVVNVVGAYQGDAQGNVNFTVAENDQVLGRSDRRAFTAGKVFSFEYAAFSSASAGDTIECFQLHVADLDDDGDDDFFAVVGSSLGEGFVNGTFYWYENVSPVEDATLDAPQIRRHVVFADLDLRVSNLVLVDLDGDEREDLVVCEGGLCSWAARAPVGQKPPFGQRRFVSSMPRYTYYRTLAAVDVDADGATDLVYGDSWVRNRIADRSPLDFDEHTAWDSLKNRESSGGVEISTSAPIGTGLPRALAFMEDNGEAFVASAHVNGQKLSFREFRPGVGPKVDSSTASFMSLDGDFNGDNAADVLAVSLSHVQGNKATIGLCLQNTSSMGSFPQCLKLGPTPCGVTDSNLISVFPLDIDGDLDLDILLSCGYMLTVYENLCDGDCVVCAQGTHMAVEASGIKKCVDCPPGRFASSPDAQTCEPCGCGWCTGRSVTRTEKCHAGYRCTNGSAPAMCAKGEYCPEGGTCSAAPSMCPPTFYCPSAAELVPCGTGKFCPQGSTAPRACSACPSGKSVTAECGIDGKDVQCSGGQSWTAAVEFKVAASVVSLVATAVMGLVWTRYRDRATRKAHPAADRVRAQARLDVPNFDATLGQIFVDFVADVRERVDAQQQSGRAPDDEFTMALASALLSVPESELLAQDWRPGCFARRLPSQRLLRRGAFLERMVASTCASIEQGLEHGLPDQGQPAAAERSGDGGPPSMEMSAPLLSG